MPSVGRDGTVSGPDFYATDREFYRFWDHFGTIFVREGREIVIDPNDGVSAQVVRSVVLGAGFALLLHQRGRLVLHASALMIKGAGVAFAGTSLQGKSTVALAFYARGHRLVADDITAIEVNAPTPTVVPAYPQINCWPQSLEQFAYDPQRLDRVEPAFEKRAFHAAIRFSEEPLPLSHVFVLDRGSTPSIEALTPQQAVIELVQHSYCYRMFTHQAAGQNLEHCARVLRSVSCYRLHTGNSLEELSQAVRLVEDAVSAR